MLADILPDGVVIADAIGELPGASLLPDEERALGHVADQRRREFTIARTCARRALAALGVPPRPILPGRHREPLWPEGIVGSLTHCVGYCAAAVGSRARLASIGIDAEVNEALPPGVLELIAVEQERRQLHAMSAPGIHLDRALFSAKESVYKAWFPLTGRWLDFTDVIVTLDPAGTFHARLLATGPTFDGQMLTAFDGRYRVESGRVLTAVVVQRRTDAPGAVNPCGSG